jgi:hypothetical protein
MEVTWAAGYRFGTRREVYLTVKLGGAQSLDLCLGGPYSAR